MVEKTYDEAPGDVIDEEQFNKAYKDTRRMFSIMKRIPKPKYEMIKSEHSEVIWAEVVKALGIAEDGDDMVAQVS